MMTPEHIRLVTLVAGRVIIKHENGNVYVIDGLCKVQVDGEWYDAVNYHQADTGDTHCRRIDDFAKFKYIQNLSVLGPRK